MNDKVINARHLSGFSAGLNAGAVVLASKATPTIDNIKPVQGRRVEVRLYEDDLAFLLSCLVSYADDKHPAVKAVMDRLPLALAYQAQHPSDGITMYHDQQVSAIMHGRAVVHFSPAGEPRFGHTKPSPESDGCHECIRLDEEPAHDGICIGHGCEVCK